MSWKPNHPPIYLLDLATEPPITDPGGEPARKLPIWRRLKAKDLCAVDDRGLSDRPETLYLLQCVSGFAMDQLRELDGYDLGNATRLMNAFLAHGPGSAMIEKRVLGLSRPPSPASTSTT
jgi:hypothetical protein